MNAWFLFNLSCLLYLQGLATLFQENDPEEDVAVSQDIGAPVTEGTKWGLQDNAFDELVVDDEKIDLKKQKKKGKEKQEYISGIKNDPMNDVEIINVNFRKTSKTKICDAWAAGGGEIFNSKQSSWI